MKTNAIIRIIVFSLVIVILIGILSAGLNLNFYRWGRSSVFSKFESDGRDSVSSSGISASGASTEGASGGTLPATGADSTPIAQASDAGAIKEIDIDWAAGSITIQAGDTDAIEYYETQVDDSDQQMVVKESGGKLSIQYCRSGFHFPSIGFSTEIFKDLVITVPRDWVCGSLDIDAASAVVQVTGLTIREVEFDGASGECTFTDCTVNELDVDTASGDITFSGSLDEMDCDAASASFYGVFFNCPRSLSMDTASGGITIMIPPECGFTVELDTLSGDFTSEFSTTSRNNRHVYGDGGCYIEMSGMSGDISILNYNNNHPTPKS